jgi:hypothetical protein
LEPTYRGGELRQPAAHLHRIALPNGHIGADYWVLINTTGGSGTEQYRFSLVAGSLPDGLQMENFFGVQ